MFANAAGFIVGGLAIPMVVYLGHGNSARGYQLTMGSFLCVSVVLFLVAFAVSKERIQPDPQQETSVTQDLADLLHNGPWIALFLVTTFYFIALAVRGSVMLPYFKYCAGNQILFSWFNCYGLTALLIGVACSTALTRLWGKRNVFFWSMALSGLLASALYFQSATGTVFFNLNLMHHLLRIPFGWVFFTEILRQFAFGCSGPVLWSMMGDVADFGEWKTGRRATATVTSGVVFALWIGLAIGGFIAGWLLSLYGYQNNAVQSAEALRGIRLTASVWAGGAFLAAAVCLLFYGISMKLNLAISQDLSLRRKSFSQDKI
jgi:Na+/melibiose symporter-like transporter